MRLPAPSWLRRSHRVGPGGGCGGGTSSHAGEADLRDRRRTDRRRTGRERACRDRPRRGRGLLATPPRDRARTIRGQARRAAPCRELTGPRSARRAPDCRVLRRRVRTCPWPASRVPRGLRSGWPTATCGALWHRVPRRPPLEPPDPRTRSRAWRRPGLRCRVPVSRTPVPERWCPGGWASRGRSSECRAQESRWVSTRCGRPEELPAGRAVPCRCRRDGRPVPAARRLIGGATPKCGQPCTSVQQRPPVPGSVRLLSPTSRCGHRVPGGTGVPGRSPSPRRPCGTAPRPPRGRLPGPAGGRAPP